MDFAMLSDQKQYQDGQNRLSLRRYNSLCHLGGHQMFDIYLSDRWLLASSKIIPIVSVIFRVILVAGRTRKNVNSRAA